MREMMNVPFPYLPLPPWMLDAVAFVIESQGNGAFDALPSETRIDYSHAVLNAEKYRSTASTREARNILSKRAVDYVITCGQSLDIMKLPSAERDVIVDLVKRAADDRYCDARTKIALSIIDILTDKENHHA